MKVTSLLQHVGLSGLAFSIAYAQSIAEINGNKFLSPYIGQNVTNVTGLVTAKGPDGFWIRSTTPDDDPRTSESIYVFSRTAATNLSTGDIITLNGRVTEFRSNTAYNFLAEITSPNSIQVVSRNNTVRPVVLGGALSPPTEQYSSLDNGDVYSLPNNSSQISRVNPVLEPTRYGLDFWESLLGELVTIRRPRAVSRPNNFGDTWVVGSWPVTGRNVRGGLTMTDKDSNPEAIIIGTPLDGTRNANATKLADYLEDITGVVFQAFGFYRILPVTGIRINRSTASPFARPSYFKSYGTCAGLTVGDYNVENLAPNSTHLPLIADHIVNYLNSPDVMFLQEIQDDNGPTNDGVVSANQTLTALIAAINAIDPQSNYSFVTIDPVNNRDGGQPGGNIRPAYLYKPSTVRLTPNSTTGTSLDANEVITLPGQKGPTLKYNPGLIDPQNPAFTSSRKPLVAQWQTVRTPIRTFFTANVHLTSKGGSTSLHGDPRPPVNGGVQNRLAQSNVTGTFLAQILSLDANASVIAAGDFNEFAFVDPLVQFRGISGLQDLDVVAGISPNERYTYLFDMNCQQLDHIFVSGKIAGRAPAYQHIHVNTWVSNEDVVSDHDPSVARVNVC